MSEIDFYFDVVCPYAYLASTEIEDLAARTGAKLNLRPILLGGIYRAIGQADVPSSQKPAAKLRVEGIDLLRWAEHRGVPLTFPDGHPRRSVEAMRLFHAAPESAWPALMHALRSWRPAPPPRRTRRGTAVRSSALRASRGGGR